MRHQEGEGFRIPVLRYKPGRWENSAGARWVVSKFSFEFFLLIPLPGWEFGANLESKFKKNAAELAPSKGVIWDEFSEQH